MREPRKIWKELLATFDALHLLRLPSSIQFKRHKELYSAGFCFFLYFLPGINQCYENQTNTQNGKVSGSTNKNNGKQNRVTLKHQAVKSKGKHKLHYGWVPSWSTLQVQHLCHCYFTFNLVSNNYTKSYL